MQIKAIFSSPLQPHPSFNPHLEFPLHMLLPLCVVLRLPLFPYNLALALGPSLLNDETCGRGGGGAPAQTLTEPGRDGSEF